jgi:hypothetical protein
VEKSASSLFSIENFILISKTTRDGDQRRYRFLIPFFAKNSRLGYFFNAKNLRRE